jgi:hypothetical protein
MDGTATPLTEVVAGATGLLLRNPDISAVHIVDVRAVDAFDRLWAESLVEATDLELDHPRAGSWKITRKLEPDVAPPPRQIPVWTGLMSKLRALGHWSAGFDGLTEGAR